MGLARLLEQLRQHHRIALDSNVAIYEVDINPVYVGLTRAIFEWIPQAGNSAATSTLTMTEVLTGPQRSADSDRADDLFAFLSGYPHLDWIAPDLKIASEAARLRGEFHLRTPDAIQAATALSSGATAFFTNDRNLNRLRGIAVLQLDDFL